MALVVPTIESITNGSAGLDMQAWVDKTDFDALQATDNLTGVISGCQVTQHTGSDMNVSVAAGVVVIAGAYVAVAAVASLAIGAASTFDRRDIVVVSNTGTVSVTAGTQCGKAGWTRTDTTDLPPVKSAIPGSSCLLGEVSVPNGTSVITTAINIVDKTAIVAVVPGTVLARAQFAPSTVTTYTLVNVTTGVTALDTTNLKVVFIVPPSGNVKVKLQGMINGGGAITDRVIFAVVSTTGSPGTLVGLTGLVYNSPTVTTADDNQICTMEQVITGLTAGSSLTWYFAGAFSGAASKVLAQGGTAVTTVPTGAPAYIEVTAL